MDLGWCTYGWHNFCFGEAIVFGMVDVTVLNQTNRANFTIELNILSDDQFEFLQAVR